MRLMIYDDTCRGNDGSLGLTHSWILGGKLYQRRGLLDAFHGVRSWEEAFQWLLDVSGGESISEIQFWGHGKWGSAYLQREILDEKSLLSSHARCSQLDALAQQLTENSMWWFRTCETFGAEKGHAFAEHFTERLGCRVAGHTYIIGPWQSGLHSLRPGQKADWSTEEGIKEGNPIAPQRALWSVPWAPHTLHCLQGHIPRNW
ncbi:MAG: DUF4347 domain-containing protein [Deltaproteobacteria bacterium]|nr:DUF4347 domain-containing protein [Deltaproteobacteria bacterium]